MPVVVFYGDESYLLGQAAEALRQSVVNPAFAGLCHKVYSTPSVATALEAVGSVSLALGGQTLVEIRDFPLLHQAAKDTGTEAQLEELKTLLENLEPTKTVLFLSTKVDGKIRFPKWLTKHPQFQVQKFESLKFWETEKAAGILLQDAKAKNIPLSGEAADLLVNTLGTDLRLLTSEVDKLALYAHGRSITPDDVLLLCNRSDNLFQLMNRWILQENPAENFKDLQEILLRRHPIEVFATIQSYFNNIFRTVWLNARGATIDTIAQRTGQKPFTIKKNLGTFRQVPGSRWLALKHTLVELEWKAKTGRLDGQLALETLLGT